MELSDVELLEAWRRGESDAGEALVARYFLPVYRFFAAHVRDDADELTQRTFEACIASRDRIRDDASFRSYLFGIARNQLLKVFERNASRPPVVPISQAEAQLMQTSPSRALVRVDQQRLVLAAVAKLPDDMRGVVEQFYLDGRTLKEIADSNAIPVGTVKSRLFRGRTMLRGVIESMAEDPQLGASTVAAIERLADDAEPE